MLETARWLSLMKRSFAMTAVGRSGIVLDEGDEPATMAPPRGHPSGAPGP
jgi:hypothetical protein